LHPCESSNTAESNLIQARLSPAITPHCCVSIQQTHVYIRISDCLHFQHESAPIQSNPMYNSNPSSLHYVCITSSSFPHSPLKHLDCHLFLSSPLPTTKSRTTEPPTRSPAPTHFPPSHHPSNPSQHPSYSSLHTPKGPNPRRRFETCCLCKRGCMRNPVGGVLGRRGIGSSSIPAYIPTQQSHSQHSGSN